MKKFSIKIYTVVSVISLIFCSVILPSCEDNYGAGNSENDVGHIHTYGGWTTVKIPDCTEEGKRERVCICGDKQSEVLNSAGHDYIRHEAKAADCLNIGWEEYSGCSRCEFSNYKEIPALGHEFGEWIITENPSCTYEGTETRVCLRDCTYAETRKVDKIGHIEGEWRVAEKPDCEAEGLKIKICETCAAELATEVIPALGHDYGEWTQTNSPTCVENGTEIRVCSKDKNHFETRSVNSTGHSYKLCFDEETHREVCEVCGETATAFPHEWSGNVCSVCGYERIIENELEFLSNDGVSYTVVGIGSLTDTEIIIPSDYRGLPVTVIAPQAFKGCSFIKKITVPESVTEIGARAFDGCELEGVDFVNTDGWELFMNGVYKGAVPKKILTDSVSAYKALNSYCEYTWKRSEI